MMDNLTSAAILPMTDTGNGVLGQTGLWYDCYPDQPQRCSLLRATRHDHSHTKPVGRL